MRITEESLKYIDKIGVYKITNVVSNKCYIGSTEKSFSSRFYKHYISLKNNRHKGYWYLQNSVNKYGIDNFEFSVLEVCRKKDCLQREEFWIEYYNACDRDFGYNSKKKPNGSPMQNKDIVEKMINSLKEGYRSGRIKKSSTIFKKGLIPWNKGKKYDSTDHLKVPKKKRGSREKFKITARNKQLPVEVYDINMNKIGEWRFIEDVIEDTTLNNSILRNHMTLINPNGRNGYDPYRLSRSNIQLSCRKGIIYKGLNFRYKTVAHVKQGELLETPEMDNQQPSSNSNVLEGSTTNSRVQTGNAEDSNADTSALPR